MPFLRKNYITYSIQYFVPSFTFLKINNFLREIWLETLKKLTKQKLFFKNQETWFQKKLPRIPHCLFIRILKFQHDIPVLFLDHKTKLAILLLVSHFWGGLGGREKSEVHEMCKPSSTPSLKSSRMCFTPVCPTF